MPLLASIFLPFCRLYVVSELSSIQSIVLSLSLENESIVCVEARFTPPPPYPLWSLLLLTEE